MTAIFHLIATVDVGPERRRGVKSRQWLFVMPHGDGL
jgi:hypothetical protein